MYGGEESLPSAALIGLMRSRVNRRTNERVPLCPGTDAQRLSSRIAGSSCRLHRCAQVKCCIFPPSIF